MTQAKPLISLCSKVLLAGRKIHGLRAKTHLKAAPLLTASNAGSLHLVALPLTLRAAVLMVSQGGGQHARPSLSPPCFSL